MKVLLVSEEQEPGSECGSVEPVVDLEVCWRLRVEPVTRWLTRWLPVLAVTYGLLGGAGGAGGASEELLTGGTLVFCFN